MKLLPIRILIVSLLYCLVVSLLHSPAFATGASLSFSPASKTVDLNQSFSVDVILNTEGNSTEETQAIVLYDASKLSVVSASLGSLYEHELTADASVSGKINFRANSTTQTYSGTGTFASIVFKAIGYGVANTNFQFAASSTIDSNVFSASSDILSLVSNGVYTVATPSGETTTSTPTASPSYTPPATGTSWPTVLLLLTGGSFLILSLAFSKTLKISN